MDFFRKLFGFPDHYSSESNDFKSSERSPPYSKNPERFLNNDIQSESSGFYNDEHGTHFNVFTDPLEMHRYFEQQMDNVFKSFGFPNFKNIFPSLEHPGVHDHLYDENNPNNRDYFLRKDYERRPHYESSITDKKVDKDLDGKLNITNLDTLFQQPDKKVEADSNENQSLNIYKSTRPFQGSFFKQSVQVKTIRKPDGSVESSRKVTDSEGNEVTTTTRKLGDKEYTVTKRRDKQGKEEIQETMVNMAEEDKSLFTKGPSGSFSFQDPF